MRRLAGCVLGAAKRTPRARRHKVLILPSPLRSGLRFSPNTYRFSRFPSRLTLIVAAAATAVLAIVLVAAALASGNPAPGQEHTALASATSARAWTISGVPGTGHGAQHKAPAPRHPAAPAASPAPSPHRHQTTSQGQAAPRRAPAHQARATQARARRAPAGQAAPATPPWTPKPFLIYDSVTPQAIPGDPVVATYADGANPDSPSQVAGFSHVLWIDIDASDPNANALDIEPGCASPSQAAGWVYNRLAAHPHSTAILYTFLSDWPEVQADVSSLPSWMQSRIRWWIADPTGTPHIVPGSQATQWYWGQSYDISTALPGF
jgi:hypothetical protein